MAARHRAVLPLLLALALVACAWFAPFDAPAAEKADAGLKRALVSFATARALNGVISVAQGTELTLQPAGVGATLAPGQLLDPGTNLVWQQFLAEDYRVSQQAIDATSSDAASSAATAQPEPAAHGVLEQLRRWFAHNTDVRARLDELKQTLEQATEYLIRLMVVFVLQTVVVPAVMLWAMWGWTRSLFEPRER